jgi:endoglucanase
MHPFCCERGALLKTAAMPKKKTAKKSTSANSKKAYAAPEFLVDLLDARSPTGHEFEAQAVVDQYVEDSVDAYRKDTMGNRFATVNPGGDPSLLFAGHIDELGLIITYINEQGFIYFDTLGGHDKTMISGRRVSILTKSGLVKGVTGKRAIHLMSAEDRKKVPETHEIWIDIGVSSREEAEKIVRIGDPAVYDQSFELIRGSVGVARAFDDKAGAYAVLEAVRRLKKGKLSARVTAAATTQEEIGTRGAMTAAFSENPDFAIAVDVGHATDSPDCDLRKYGSTKQGGGPIVCRGPNINPVIFDRIVACAEKNKIPYQLEADPRPTGTDARALQVAQAGIATGLLSIPLRYMHTPSEMVDLEDIEHTVQLLVAVAKSLKKGDRGIW